MNDSRKPGSSSNTGELERLQRLLLGDQPERLFRLDHRVTDLEARTSDVAEVLPGAMNRLVEDPVTKPEIEQPIVDTIRGAIKRDTESFAEALFPVLGPAIRRAVADALKSLVQRINVAMENSLTAKGLRWRMEAARSGVPFAQVVLSHTMVYAVQEAFLIQRSSGLVLASVHRDETLALDEDAVSAMLTAIQSFIHDSLGLPDHEPLRSAELGDRTLWVINGPKTVLACVIIGSPPRDVRDELMQILERLHAQFGDRFTDHPEALAHHPGIHALMQQALREEVDEGVRGSGASWQRWLWAGLALLLVAFLAWSSWRAYLDRQLESRVGQAFATEPGYVLTGRDARKGTLTLSGLRDPLARSPETVLADADLDVSQTILAFRAYQSLETELVLRRLRAALGDADSLVLDLEGSSLRVRGPMSAEQAAWLSELPASHPVIQTVSLEQTGMDNGDAAPSTSEPPPVPEAVRQQLMLTQRFDTLLQDINGHVIQFPRAYRLSEDSLEELDGLGRDLTELQGAAASLGIDLTVRLEGHTDGVGTAEENREVAMTRARTVQEELTRRGVDTSGFELVRAPWVSGAEDASERKVVVLVSRPSGS